jgi:hypothetical protein
MENIPTTPNVPNPWIINLPQQEPQAPKARHDDNLASSSWQLAQLLIPQWKPQAQKEKACRNDNLASSAHQLGVSSTERESTSRCNFSIISTAISTTTW